MSLFFTFGSITLIVYCALSAQLRTYWHQLWLEKNLGQNNFWTKDYWPPSSPDAKPRGFSFSVKLVRNTELRTQRIAEWWNKLLEPDCAVKTFQQTAGPRLQRIVYVSGDYIENDYVPLKDDGNQVHDFWTLFFSRQPFFLHSWKLFVTRISSTVRVAHDLQDGLYKEIEWLHSSGCHWAVLEQAWNAT